MKIDIVKNRKVLIKFSKKKFELHPLWLRERASSINLIDPLTKQRIYDPSALEKSIKIKKANFKKNLLNVEFSDGINSKFKLDELYKELNTNEMKKDIEKKLLWNSTLKKRPAFKFNKDFESKEVFKMLKKFHKFGFVIINKVPTKNNYIVKFANSIGAIRPTNFGIYFDVKSIPDYNDLAYTPRHLYPHTDNPYRKPVQCNSWIHGTGFLYGLSLWG
jgi:gamma-butyrobetaine dioxygenase